MYEEWLNGRSLNDAILTAWVTGLQHQITGNIIMSSEQITTWNLTVVAD
jgi:hypothetical protein